jgi:hypothetical protein
MEAPPIQMRVAPAGKTGPPDDRGAASLDDEPGSRGPRGRRKAVFLALFCAVALLGIGVWAYSRIVDSGSEGNTKGITGGNPAASSYCELDPEAGVILERDPEHPGQLSVVYCPTSAGTVAFRVAGRDGEWFQEVASNEIGEDHVFELPGDVKPGDMIRVTFRRDGSLATQDLRVAEATPTNPSSGQGLYARRTMADRETWIGRYGGTAASERAVADALEWLARHQADDGSWSNHCLGTGHPEAKCEKDSPCSGPGGPYEMALSGLALLAFQAGGHYDFNEQRYSQNVRRAIDWMIARQRPDGGLLGSKQDRARRQFYPQFMYEHGIATFALADACAVAEALRRPKNPRYADALGRAVRFIDQMQHDDGGWRYTEVRRQPSDASVTGWQVLALKSAREAGISLSADGIEKVRAFFESCATGERGRTGYQGRSVHTEATTGVGMLARQFLLGQPDAPYVRDAAEYLAGYAEANWRDRAAHSARSDYYLWYNCTLAMFQAGGEVWNRWNEVVREAIVGLQRHEGCARGSWDPDPKWGHEGGRIYATALAALTLEVYYRYANLIESSPPSAGKPPPGASDPGTSHPLIRRKKP